jgi:peptidoglycan/LPS O-acetylase OafA/YrhL
VNSQSRKPVVGGEHANKSHIHGLDGLRGVAAFAVLGFHLDIVRHQGTIFGHAYMAVDFFFLLSGFVIGMAYEPRMAGSLSLRTYARARLARLYPMIVLGALLGCGVGFLMGVKYPLWAALALQLAFIPTAGAQGAYPLNVSQWSLFFELFVNFFHAVFFKVLTTSRLFAVVVLSAVWLVATDSHFGGLGVGWKWGNFTGGFACATFSFAGGLWIYRLYRAKRLPIVELPYPVVVLLLGAALVLPATPYWRDSVLSIVAFPAILTLAVSSRVPRSMDKIVTWAGAVSYPLYAIHLPLLYMAAFLDPKGSSHLIRAAYWGLVIFAIVGMASVVEHYLDAPIRRWLQGRGRPLAPNPAALTF